MENVRKKLMVLAKVANKLNQKKIDWAIGASMLLYFKGIASEFHDIDIVVAEEDVETLKEVILTFGTLLPEKSNRQYRTKYFLEFQVEDIDIDVMAA